MQRPKAAAAALTLAPPPGARRRAADVVIIGGSLQAAAAAYVLAKRGKRTVWIDHAAPPRPGAAVFVPADVVLHLPAHTPHAVSEATEALGLWRGIEAASGAQDLLQLCGSIDVAPGASGAAADALGAMQESSKASGLPFALLAAQEASAAFPLLRPPRGSAALYTPHGGVLQRRVAEAALAAMAARVGGDVPAARRRRCLLGWRDMGGYFAIRVAALPSPAHPATAAAADGGAAGGGPEEEVVYECEQLLVLPEAGALQPTLGLFGLVVPGAALWTVPAGRWAATEECAALPVWQLLGSCSGRAAEDPGAVDSCWGLPVLGWGPPSNLMVAHCLTDGQPAQAGQAAAASGTSSSSGSVGQGTALNQQQPVQLQSAAATPGAAVGGCAVGDLKLSGFAEEPGSEDAQDRQRQAAAAAKQRWQQARQRLASAGSLAAVLIHGLGGQLSIERELLLSCTVTPDGEPAIGSHPGFERGRLVAGFAATSAAAGSLPAGDQLAPLLARLAADELLGRAPEAVEPALVALEREALGAAAVPLQRDTWAELHLEPALLR